MDPKSSDLSNCWDGVRGMRKGPEWSRSALSTEYGTPSGRRRSLRENSRSRGAPRVRGRGLRARAPWRNAPAVGQGGLFERGSPIAEGRARGEVLRAAFSPPVSGAAPAVGAAGSGRPPEGALGVWRRRPSPLRAVGRLREAFGRSSLSAGGGPGEAGVQGGADPRARHRGRREQSPGPGVPGWGRPPLRRVHARRFGKTIRRCRPIPALGDLASNPGPGTVGVSCGPGQVAGPGGGPLASLFAPDCPRPAVAAIGNAQAFFSWKLTGLVAFRSSSVRRGRTL